MRDYLVIYDALCGPCTRFKHALDFFDVFEKIGFMPLREADEEGRLAGVPLSARFRSFHMVLPGGEIRSGADALPHLIEQLPAGKVASRLIKSAPFGSKLMRSLYLVASRLHEGKSCARIERSR